MHGQSSRYHHTRVGVGGRLDTLQAAVLLAKLERFEWELQRRAKIGARYDALLADVTEANRVTVRPDRNSVYAQYTVVVPQRAAVQAALQAAGVPTAVHYPRPLHLQPAYAPFAPPGGCPVSEKLAQQVLSLPMSADLDAADQDRVVSALRLALTSLEMTGLKMTGLEMTGLEPREAAPASASAALPMPVPLPVR